MARKKSSLADRAWSVLRLALLWARKGGIFKRRLMVDLRLLPNHLKSLRHTVHDSIHYKEREFSFDETPIFHFKMHKPASMRFHMPHIPCLNPPVDFDFDFNGDGENNCYDQDCRKSFLRDDDREEDYDCGKNSEIVPCVEGIDLKAEEFIAKFYEQMKLQRQISHLQYNEMLDRGTN